MDHRQYRKSHFLYDLFIPFLHLEYRFLFRKIYWHKRRTVPINTPVLIAANHPTAFIDPIFFCLFFDPPVYNMTRGDIFRKPFFRKLLMKLNMFPVYRRRDGYDQRDRNDEVFEFCRLKLKKGVAVNIFVEGEHHIDKRVLPLQKGLARIAFGAYEQDRMDELQIIPVGCNYINGDTLRDEAKIIVGTPIFVKDYWERYEKSAGGAITELCTDIRNALKQICYHIEDPADDVLGDQMLALWRHDHPDTMLPIVQYQADRFFEEKKVLEQLNTMNPDVKTAVKAKATTYFEALKHAGLEDETLVQPQQGSLAWILFFILGLPFWVLGSLINWPVRTFAMSVSKSKVKKREFFTSVYMGLSTLGNFVYFLILMLAGLIAAKPGLISLALLLPIITWFSVFYQERWAKWLAARKALAHPDRANLLSIRQAIMASI